jgi:hypothetical protein
MEPIIHVVNGGAQIFGRSSHEAGIESINTWMLHDIWYEPERYLYVLTPCLSDGKPPALSREELGI